MTGWYEKKRKRATAGKGAERHFAGKSGARNGERALILLFVVSLALAAAGCGDRKDEVMSLAGEETAAVSAESVVGAEDTASSGTEADASAAQASSMVADGAQAQDAQTAGSSEGEGSTGSGTAAVYICGAVLLPGVYEITDDMRLVDAVQLAGGFTADADETYWNLAQKLTDGAMYYIPTTGETAEEDFSLAGNGEAIGETEKDTGDDSAAADGGAEASGSDEGLVSINTATKEELMTLPGIGATKAAAIITYRETNGAFTSTDEITNVTGIGESTYEKLKDYICL